MTPDALPSPLTAEADEALILAACGGAPTTQEQIERFLTWAQETLVFAGMLRLAMAGTLVVDVTSKDQENWTWRLKE